MSTQDRISVVLDIGGDVSNLQAALNKVQSSFKNFKMSEGFSKGVESDMKDAQRAIDKLAQYAKKEKITLLDQKGIEKTFKEFESAYNRLFKSAKSKELAGFDTSKMTQFRTAINNINSAMDKYNKELQDARENQQKLIEGAREKAKADLDAAKTAEKIAYKAEVEKVNQEQGTNFTKQWTKAQATDLAALSSKYNEYYQKRITAEQKLQAANDRRAKAEVGQNSLAVAALQQLQTQVDAVAQKFPELNLGERLTTDNAPQKIQEIVTKLQELGTTDAQKSIDELFSALGQATPAADNFSKKINESRGALEKLNATGKDIDQLRNRLMYFFGIGNTIQLFKRSIRSAYNTLKDLDEVMTETAVVTKFDISDMWAQLPTYVQRANELGLTIHDVYESMTLFYQQGLNTTEATELSTQALKMARIAGLDAATAVDRVTNALRGFNMELNEASATNIADVYSKLAAITASNVDEISTAMTKVASLANNANMSFENTAAFLAQIIESTRESAETAGTALKTVIARFSEVKKLYSEGDLLGTDEEGEGIDVNRISTALRTAGINLNEYLTGMKGLDEIFMELAEKWDGLSIVQQRYIATQAAGSRQQSRFIALMSDYQRTLELTTAAENATGASQEQYEKTLESVESKLNQLKNAWNEFTMGIMNSGFLKAVIDFARGVLNAINAITGKLPGLLKSVANLGVIFGGLKLGKNLLFGKNGLVGAVGAALSGKEVQGIGKKAGSLLSKIFVTGFTDQTKMAQKAVAQSLHDLETAAVTKIPIQINDLEPVYVTNTMAVYDYKAALDSANLSEQSFATIKKASSDEQIQGILITKASTDSALAEALATDTLTDAQLAEAYAEAGGIKNKLISIGLKIRSALTTDLETSAVGKLIAALYGQAVVEKIVETATKKKNLAMLMSLGYLALIIAAIAALIAIIVVLTKTAEKNSLEGRLKQVDDNIKALNDKLTETKEKLDDIKDASDAFTELQDKVNHAVKGTQEWKDALVAANQQVLDLSEKYPELKEAITIGANGQLTFRAGTLDEFYDKLLTQANNLTTGILIQEDKRRRLQGLEDGERGAAVRQAISMKASGNGALGELLNEETQIGFFNAFAQGQIDLSKVLTRDSVGATVLSQAGKEMATTLGMSEKAFLSMAEAAREDETAFREHSEVVYAATSTGTTLIDSIFGQDETLTKSGLNDAFAGISETFNDFDQEVLNTKTVLNQNTQELADQAYELFGYDYRNGKWYASTAQDAEEVKNVDMAQLVAEQLTTQKLTTEAENFVASVGNVTQETKDLINRLLSSEGSLIASGDKNVTQDTLAAMGLSQKWIDTYWEQIKHNMDYAAEKNAIYVQDAINKGVVIKKNTLSQFSNNVLQGLTEQFDNIETTGQRQEYSQALKEMLEGLTIEEQEALIQAFNQTDLEDIDSIQKISKFMEDLGFEIPEDKMDAFEDALIRIGKAVSNVMPSIAGLTSVLEKLQNGETTFSKDEYSEIINKGIAKTSDFVANGEDWIYIGETLAKGTIGYVEQGFNNLFESRKNAQLRGDIALADQNTGQINQLAGEAIMSGNYELMQLGMAYGEDISDQLIAAALQYKELTGAVQKYQQALKSGTAAEKEYAEQELRIQLLSKTLTKQIDSLMGVIDDNRETLEKGEEAGEAYKDALNQVLAAAQTTFGELVDEKFVTENIGLFMRMADGDTAALEEIRSKLIAMKKESLNTSSTVGSSMEQILNIIDALDGSSFDIYGNLKDEKVIEALNNILAGLTLTSEEAEAFIAMMDGLGYSLNWEWDTATMPVAATIKGKAHGADRESEYTMMMDGSGTVQYPTGKLKVTKLKDTGGSSVGSRTPSTTGSSGGSSGGSDKTDKWENPYDELYNLTEQVNEALRDREKLERDYDRILNNRKATSQELINNSLAEIENLRHEIDLQKQLLEGRRRQLANLANETHTDSEGNEKTFSQWGVTKYASYDEKTGLVEIDWEGIDAIEDTTLGEAVEAYVSRIEELSGQIEDVYDSIEDMSDKIDEIKERNKGQWLELEQRVYDAIVQQKQAVIDEYQAISDSLADSNSRIIDSLQESIDMERQIRDNTKKEEELSDMEQRLAYLQRDTSGANQTEILKLQKELEEKRQDYQDTLIDQSIQKLSDENQKAQEQREKQIEIMQAQLDWDAENGKFWDETHALIDAAIDKDGNLKNNSAMVTLLKETEAFKGMSHFGQENWLTELAKEWKEAQEGLYNWEHPNDQPTANTQPKKENAPTTNTGGGGKKTTTTTETGEGGKGLIASLGTELSKADVKKLQEGLLQLKSKGIISFGGLYADGDYGWYTEQAVKALQRKLNELTNAGLVIDGLWGKYTRAAFQKSSLKAYKTGGLADFTGPAWLDGSLTNPELVLNATDTRNFMSLIDMLRNLAVSGQSLNDMSFGDYLFNITVNAELSNDYDVDQLVSRVKDRISNEASYRNINTLSRYR